MSARPYHPDDPRGLIHEAYRIEGIRAEDCKSIFFDWALGLPDPADAPRAAQALLDHHSPPSDHPMTALLREATAGGGVPVRRGGARRRRS